MEYPSYVWAACLCISAYALYRRYFVTSVSHIRGPSPESFWLGNLRELFQSQAGEADFKWQKQYGDVVRIKGTLGEDRLLISDPKALQYIFHTSGYNFLKWPERTEISRVLMGRGLLWSDGEIHRRQRKVMLPGFGAPEAKSYVPIFRQVADQLCVKWEDLLAAAPDQTSVVDVPHWLTRATLDTIGQAAFDYNFNALENSENEFAESYFGLMADTLGSPPKSAIFLHAVSPVWFLNLLARFSPSRNRAHARSAARIANRIAKEMIDTKADALSQGKGNKDIMSLLVKANTGENEKGKLSEEEMFGEMRTILLAGHETVAVTLLWTLLELARHPEVQNTLRKEIRETEKNVRAHGGTYFTANDLDDMPYLAAVLKESMRFHPALYQNYRVAVNDDVIPLSKPIVNKMGQEVQELQIPKSIKIIASIAAYNRNKEVFGEDADVWNPDRWLKDSQERKGPTLGVYGNLLTFAGGVRTCIGWRFAVLESMTYIVELVNRFEFAMTEVAAKNLRREACLVMLPTVEGEVHKGEQLPLQVTIAQRD